MRLGSFVAVAVALASGCSFDLASSLGNSMGAALKKKKKKKKKEREK